MVYPDDLDSFGAFMRPVSVIEDPERTFSGHDVRHSETRLVFVAAPHHFVVGVLRLCKSAFTRKALIGFDC